jgi:hypothetical protein
VCKCIIKDLTVNSPLVSQQPDSLITSLQTCQCRICTLVQIWNGYISLGILWYCYWIILWLPYLVVIIICVKLWTDGYKLYLIYISIIGDISILLFLLCFCIPRHMTYAKKKCSTSSPPFLWRPHPHWLPVFNVKLPVFLFVRCKYAKWCICWYCQSRGQSWAG